MSFEKKIPSDDTLKNGLKDIANAICDAETMVSKEDVNTDTFDPTSDNPASQKSTYNAIIPVTLEKLDQNLQETIRIHGVHIDNNRADINANTDEIEKMEDSLNTGTFDPTSDNPASQKSIAGAMEKQNQSLQNQISANTSSIATNRTDINKNTAEIESLKASVNTGTFDPTSDNPAGQKSIMDAIIEADLNARFSRASSGDLSGAFGNLPSYYSGKFHLLRSTCFPWGGNINFHFLFAYSRITEVDYSPYLDDVFEKAGSIDMRACFLSSGVRIINAAYSLRKVKNLYDAFNMVNIKTIKLRDYPVSFDISHSTKFEESDLVEILNNLMDLTGKTPQTLTMGATNLAKLTDKEKAIATNKNWVLA